MAEARYGVMLMENISEGETIRPTGWKLFDLRVDSVKSVFETLDREEFKEQPENQPGVYVVPVWTDERSAWRTRPYYYLPGKSWDETITALMQAGFFPWELR